MSTVAPIKCTVCTWEYARQSAVDKHFETVHAKQSEQLRNLIKRYSVDTESQLVRAIQDSYERETEERPSKAAAEALLDDELEVEYQRIEGGAYDFDTPIPEDVKPEPIKIVDVQKTTKVTRMFTPDKSKWLGEPRLCANGCGYNVVLRKAVYGTGTREKTYEVLVHTGIPLEIAEQVINHCVAK